MRTALVDQYSRPLTAKTKSGPRAGYEAASWFGDTRSQIFHTVQDSKRDLNSPTRRELLRKSRYFYDNSPIARAIISQLVTYVIGTGLRPVPASADDRWNADANQAFEAWSPHADIGKRMSWEEMQRVICGSAFIDGELFSMNTYDRAGRPREQLIESHRIGGGYGEDDGIKVDEYGAPEFYQYWMDDYGEKTDDIPAEDIQHYFFIRRANQRRGEPLFAAALNQIHDLDDILALEKQSVKIASKDAAVIHTATGEDDEEEDAFIGRSLKPDSEQEEDREVYYRKVLGAEAKVMKHGDQYKLLTPNRPSPAWQGFVDFMANMVALSTGIPPCVLLHTKMGGVDTRRDLAAAQRVFEVWQQSLSFRFRGIWEYVIRENIALGYLRNPPADWKRMNWQFPRSITADYGREAAADRADVQAGLLSRREYYGRYGMDWREEELQHAREDAEIRKIRKDAGATLPEWMQKTETKETA